MTIYILSVLITFSDYVTLSCMVYRRLRWCVMSRARSHLVAYSDACRDFKSTTIRILNFKKDSWL